MTAADRLRPAASRTLGRRIATFLYRRPGSSSGCLLAAPVGWLVVVYLGSLARAARHGVLEARPVHRQVVHEYGFDNFRDARREPTSTGRSRSGPSRSRPLVTLTDAVLAFPIAYYMARVASPRTRRLLVVAVLMPLWASYLVKVYAWRVILSEEGVLNWALAPLGLERARASGTSPLWLVFTYLWLPYMILPIYAGLERIPDSLLEASADLGAAAADDVPARHPAARLPGVVAGSIFTFSLTLGDYITPDARLEHAVHRERRSTRTSASRTTCPFAAAFATRPVVVMIVYLLVARRLGAFETL